MCAIAPLQDIAESWALRLAAKSVIHINMLFCDNYSDAHEPADWQQLPTQNTKGLLQHCSMQNMQS